MLRSRRGFDEFFHRAGELTIGEHYQTVTAQAAQADIRANPIDAPPIASARVRFARLDYVAHPYGCRIKRFFAWTFAFIRGVHYPCPVIAGSSLSRLDSSICPGAPSGN